MEKQNRLNWIDWAKSIGIFLVVFGHSFYPPEDSFEFSIKQFIYSFHMPLFFFISGFLFKIKEYNFLNFVKQSAKSLIIPYVFLNIISFIVIVPLVFKNEDAISKLLFSFLIGESHAPAGPAWFLLCLFFIRIFSFYIIKIKISAQFIIILLSAIIAYCIPVDLYWAFDSSFMALPIFIIGYHCNKYSILSKNSKTYVNAILFMILFFILFILNHIQGRVDINMINFGNYPYLYYIESISGILMVIYFSKLLNNFDIQIIKVFSSGSIIIMGLHIVVYLYIKAFVNKLFPELLEYGIIFSFFESLFIMIILYYPIIFMQKHCSFFIGGRKIERFMKE